MTDLSLISPHAVMRYIERVMRLTVAPDLWRTHDTGNRMNAASMACRVHGLTVDQVRRIIMQDAPMVSAILAAGITETKIIRGEFAYVFRYSRLVTVIYKWMRDEADPTRDMKDQGKRESRREAHKAGRRWRKKAKADDRAKYAREEA